ncbi:MAG TPA: NADH-quinone oxidoreductase subunit L, partial [Roseiflexaceae bacterium]|nr:NADH-quinone oxidoreductase subunit L [Roseiflexaceae bacterium]
MSDLTWIVWLIPAFPLLGFLINALFIRRERPAGLIACAAVLLSFVCSLIAIYVLQTLPAPAAPEGAAEGAAAEAVQRIDYVLWEWISVGGFRVPFGLLFDQLTAVMALLVTGVGGLIHIYSIGYMHGDARPVRYFAYLNLFITAMLFLVMGDNLLLLFLGWEGVGLCSFLLIGHWFDRKSVPPGIVPAEASVKAFVVNRVGDAGMLLAMMAIFANLGSLNFFPVDPLQNGQTIPGFLEGAPQLAAESISLGVLGSINLLTAITFLLLIGVTGKSAQIPLFTWLPDAMAGPTPVSALIHAATMVTSGVYLIARNHALFDASPTTQGWILAIGMLTALLAASAAVAQFDIKRVLAYSTVSQLGYMVAAVGTGAYVAAMFHLLTHGIFKALLFLGSGSIIHGTHDTQDMRRMGGLKDKMPTTYWTYLIGSLALAGIVPLAGFWSKDEIIAHIWAQPENSGKLAAVMLMAASAITAFYMGRQVALIFFGSPRDHNAEHAHESGPIMLWPLIILAFGAVIGGVMNLPGTLWLEHFLEPVFHTPAEPVEPAAFNYAIAIGSTIVALGSGYLGWWMYARLLASRIKPGREDPGHRYLGDIWRGMEIAWGFDWFYERIVVRAYRAIARFLSDVFDAQGIDGILVDGTAHLFGRLAQWFRKAQTGYVRNYALV